MSSDNPQNTEQPGEFEDLQENAPNQDPAPATTSPKPAPILAPTPTPPQPGLTKSDQSSQPEGKVDPAKIREEETKSLQEKLERLRQERENQNEVINRLTSTNTKLQEKFDVAEKQHKVQQENAVEVATKAAVGQATRERDAARTERDRTRRNVKIRAAVIVLVIVLLSVGLLGFAAHDILETGPKSNTAVQQPTAASGQNTSTAANEKEEDPILKRIKALTKSNPNAKTNK